MGTSDDIAIVISATEQYISRKVEAATRVLQSSFEPAISLGVGTPEGVDPLQVIISAGDSYAKDLEDSNSSFEIFKGVLASITEMRSTYLPIEYLTQEVDSGGTSIVNVGGTADFTSAEIAEQQAFFESYENSFMRMLGMPSSEDLDENSEILRITQDGQLKYMTTADLKEYVLSVRQLDHSSRPYSLGDGYFTFAGASKAIDKIPESLISMYESAVKAWGKEKDRLYEALEASAADTTSDEPLSELSQDESDNLLTGELSDYWILLTTGTVPGSEDINLYQEGIDHPTLEDIYTEEMLGQAASTTIDSIVDPSNFFRLSYLLSPPVQDKYIVGCINEPSKIVSPNFLPKSQRKVNNTIVRSSFLEAIIRLRLDKISGVDPAMLNTEAEATSTTIGGVEVKSYEQAAAGGGYGILEALIVARLEAAVMGMARYVKKNAQNMKLSAHRNEQNIDDTDNNRASPNQASKFVNFESKFFPEIAHGPNAAASERSLFETIIAIEDAINLFFTDDSEPYDLTRGTQRGSTMNSAHLMDAVISIVGQPGVVARERLSQLIEERDKRAKKTGDRYRAGISSVIGDVNGVGIIDVAVFLLSLFLIEEKFLLGMMTTSELEHMTLQYPEGFFDTLSGVGVPRVEDSINELTKIMYVNYMKFLESIRGTNRFYYGGRLA